MKGSTEAMFKTVEATLPVRGWMGGAVEWEFKTTDPSAVLLYQEGHAGQKAALSVTLQNCKPVTWVMSVNCVLLYMYM